MPRSITLDTRRDRHRARRKSISWACRCCTCRGSPFPLSNERKSGFLFPSIGNTSTGGLQLSVPYYWNIAPNPDFTFEPTEYSSRGTDLGADLRFLTADQHGELDWNFLPDDLRATAASRSRVRLNDVAELPAGFRLTLMARERQRHRILRGLLPGPGRREHRVPQPQRRPLLP